MSIKHILLTGGRAPATLDLARRLHRFGHKVYVAESLEHHLCRYSSAVQQHISVPAPALHPEAFVTELITCIKQHRIDLLIPTCEEIFYIAKALNQLREFTSVVSDSFDKLIQLHNKFTFNQLINNANTSRPKTFLMNDRSEYQKLMDEHVLDFPHVLKPMYSRFAAETQIIRSPKHISLEMTRSKPWVAQEFISGEMICTYSICHKGAVMAHVAYKNNCTAGEHGAGIGFQAIQHELLYQWVCDMAKRLDFSGQLAFDVIETSDGKFWPIECNPRATSGIHLLPLDVDLVSVFLGRMALPMSCLSSECVILRLPMLWYAGAYFTSWHSFLMWLHSFLKGKDAVFCSRDPLPFFSQVLIAWNFFNISRKHNIGMVAATTRDIEWNGAA